MICSDRLILIDADAVVYSVGFALDKQEDVSYRLMSLFIDKTMSKILKDCQSYRFISYLTSDDKTNFRFRDAVTPGPHGLGYKAQRKKSNRPKLYADIRKYLVDNWQAEIVAYREADDMLSITATEDRCKPVIATCDKDLNMVPVDIYNIRTGFIWKFAGDELKLLREFYLDGRKKLPKLQGRGWKWFYAQMLLGDSIDNIPGAKGYGPVKVYGVLENCWSQLEYINATWEVYKKLGYDKARFLEIARLLWMQTKDIPDIRIYLEENYKFK